MGTTVFVSAALEIESRRWAGDAQFRRRRIPATGRHCARNSFTDGVFGFLSLWSGKECLIALAGRAGEIDVRVTPFPIRFPGPSGPVLF